MFVSDSSLLCLRPQAHRRHLRTRVKVRAMRAARRDAADDVARMPDPRSSPAIVVVNVGDARRRRDHGVDSIELTLTAADRDRRILTTG